MAVDIAALAARIRIGLAGWSYRDWRGTFYPLDRTLDFSELRFAAECFDCLEINSTFYGLPSAKNTRNWARTVADLDGFLFTAKLTRDLTHHHAAPAEATVLCQRYRDGIAPLVEAGRLGAVLLQFPHWFDDTPEHRERIALIASELDDLPLVVEVRHRSFLDGSASGALPFLERLGMDFANIDFPRGRTSTPPTCVNTGSTGYYRLHGRNRDSWFDPQAGRDDKYDYLYPVDELEEFVPSIRKLAARTQVTFVIANNHFRGQAPANGFQLAHLLKGESPPVPPALLATYPQLADVGKLGADLRRGGRAP